RFRRRLLLLAQRVDDGLRLAAFEELDVIAGAVRRPEAVGRPSVKEALLDDFREESARVVVQLFRARLVEDLREAAAQFPRLEERRPVDERFDALQRNILEDADAEERR